MYVEYIVAVVDLNICTRTKQISGMHITQISARFVLICSTLSASVACVVIDMRVVIMGSA